MVVSLQCSDSTEGRGDVIRRHWVCWGCWPPIPLPPSSSSSSFLAAAVFPLSGPGPPRVIHTHPLTLVGDSLGTPAEAPATHVTASAHTHTHPTPPSTFLALVNITRGCLSIAYYLYPARLRDTLTRISLGQQGRSRLAPGRLNPISLASLKLASFRCYSKFPLSLTYSRLTSGVWGVAEG